MSTDGIFISRVMPIRNITFDLRTSRERAIDEAVRNFPHTLQMGKWMKSVDLENFQKYSSWEGFVRAVRKEFRNIMGVTDQPPLADEGSGP